MNGKTIIRFPHLFLYLFRTGELRDANNNNIMKQTTSADEFADFLNQSIAEMIASIEDAKKECDGTSIIEKPSGRMPNCGKIEGQPEATTIKNSTLFAEYTQNREAIEDLFENPNLNGQLSELLIYQRLALIDLFYGTNVFRMRQFGLEELASAIWSGCYDATTDAHSDAILANKAISFVNTPSDSHLIHTDLFAKSYGYVVDTTGVHSQFAESLLSKYLFFLVNAHGDKVGFPIYDSIVRGLSKKIGKKLGLPVTKNETMHELTALLNSILAKLKSRNGKLWQNLPKGIKSQYDLLDYFLWRIGKVGRFSFSLIITRSEFAQYWPDFVVLKQIEADKNLTKKEKEQKMRDNLDCLPEKYRKWHDIYTKI